jgi:hypothetical protein
MPPWADKNYLRIVSVANSVIFNSLFSQVAICSLIDQEIRVSTFRGMIMAYFAILDNGRSYLILFIKSLIPRKRCVKHILRDDTSGMAITIQG